ncbi:ABC transporter ATP-binding protein [Cohnella luojiensis]|nr:ABC transporter ATP-binding protein [Cohnella luojiensis]
MASVLATSRISHPVKDISEQGKLIDRMVILTSKQLELLDAEGNVLWIIGRRELDKARILDTGSGAYLEISDLRGESRRIAFSPLSGMRGLYRCQRSITDWVNEDLKGPAQRGAPIESRSSADEKWDEEKTKPLTLRQRIRIISRLAHYALPYRNQILLSAGVLLLTVALEMAPPYLFKEIIDGGVLPSSNSKFAGLIGLLLTVYILQALLAVVRTSISIRIGSQVMSHIRKDMFDKLISLSVRFYERRKTVHFIGRVQNDANGIQGLLTKGITSILVQLLMACSILVILFILDWQISLLIVSAIAISCTLLWRVFPVMRSLMNRKWNADYWLQQYISETLHGIRVVKAFHRDEKEKELFREYNETSVRRMMDQQRYTLWLKPGISLAISTSVAMVWFFGGRQVMNGAMSFGTVIAFTAYLSMFLEQLQGNFRITKAFNASLMSADRILELLHTEAEVSESKHPIAMPVMRGEIVVKSLAFGYEKGINVLKDVNLHIRAGEKIGIVGRSGAGKTTLIHLLCRFYDPDAGSIEIDGVDLRQLAISDLRRHVGIVFQETYLFDGTIADNIAFGCPEASPEQIIAAARQANAHGFISRLPYGYDTNVGERGEHLSGGEKQRISIARTLLQNPSVLILDEATSSVDIETEREIQEALEQLCKGRTTIAIAHRLHTLSNTDRIVQLDKGRIIDSTKSGYEYVGEGVR